MTNRINDMQTSMQSQLAAADSLLASLESQQKLLTSSIQSLQYTTFGRNTQNQAELGRTSKNMSEDLDALLSELESVTREMTAGGAQLPGLSQLCLRRGELVARVIAGNPDESCLARLQAACLAGAEAERRVRELRESIRSEIAELGRSRILMDGLASVLPPNAHSLDTLG